MTDRWSQPKAKHLELHGKVDNFVRKKTVNKDTQEQNRTSGLITTTNVPKKRQDAPFDELSRTMKAQNHGSPTQSKLIRPLMSPPKPKGSPIQIPKATITVLDDEMPTSPLQRKTSSLDRVRTSPSSRKSASPSVTKTRIIESVSDLAEMPTTFEEHEALGHKDVLRLGGDQRIKKHIESLQQPDVSANGKKLRRDSSRGDRHRTKDSQRLSTISRKSIGPPSSDLEEDDDIFKDVPVGSAKSTDRSKKTVSSGALIPAGSAGSARSTEPSKCTGANRPLSRTVTEKPRLFLEKKTAVKIATVGSRYRQNSEDYGSDDFQRDRSIRKNKDTSVEAVKSTLRSFKEEEYHRRSLVFFEEIGPTEKLKEKPKEKPKDFFNMSKPQPPKSQERSENRKVSLSSSQLRAKDGSQRRMEDRDKAVKSMGSKKKDRSSTLDMVELLDDDSDHLPRSSPSTKRTRAAQSSSDSESEKESEPKSRTKSDARSRTPPVQARAVAPKDTSKRFSLPSPTKKKYADERFTLPSPSKKKSCYESPSGYMSNQIIYMLSDDDIPRKGWSFSLSLTRTSCSCCLEGMVSSNFQFSQLVNDSY